MPVFLVARDDGGDGGGLRRPAADRDRASSRSSACTCCRHHRGSGIGRLLLAALEDEARALGAERVVLETGAAQHEAVGLYESNGYRPIPCYGAYAASADLALLRARARLYAVARG